jgi:HMG (high mobility group) box
MTDASLSHKYLCFDRISMLINLLAFILYRQHYQAQIVAQHPGLANPEISKIIGEQWRDQPVEVKNEWKRLAEVPCIIFT